MGLTDLYISEGKQSPLKPLPTTEIGTLWCIRRTIQFGLQAHFQGRAPKTTGISQVIRAVGTSFVVKRWLWMMGSWLQVVIRKAKPWLEICNFYSSSFSGKEIRVENGAKDQSRLQKFPKSMGVEEFPGCWTTSTLDGWHAQLPGDLPPYATLHLADHLCS